jgi:hypothetical protein
MTHNRIFLHSQFSYFLSCSSTSLRTASADHSSSLRERADLCKRKHNEPQLPKQKSVQQNPFVVFLKANESLNLFKENQFSSNWHRHVKDGTY